MTDPESLAAQTLSIRVDVGVVLPAVVPMGRRVSSLDGLRVVAALAVFLSHWVGLGGPAWWVDWLPISILWNGQAAVIFFLILSGFALTRSLERIPPSFSNYWRFIGVRILRIYPLYWAALALALGLRLTLSSPPGLALWGAWAQTMWLDALDLRQLLAHVFLIGPGLNSRAVNPVIWVLVAEMRMSFLMPLLVWSLPRLKPRALTLGAMMLTALIASKFQQLFYLPLFVLGTVMSHYYAALVRKFRELGRLGWLLIGLAAILCMTVRVPDSALLPYSVTMELAAVGWAAVMVAADAMPVLKNVLCGAKLQSMAGLSYAFYLVHLPILLAFASRWPWRSTIGWLILGIVSLVVSFAVAYAAFRWVERPIALAAKR